MRSSKSDGSPKITDHDEDYGGGATHHMPQDGDAYHDKTPTMIVMVVTATVRE